MWVHAAHLLDELRAGVLDGVLELDGARDGHAIVDDLRHAVPLLKHHVAPCTLPPESRLRSRRGVTHGRTLREQSLCHGASLNVAGSETDRRKAFEHS